MPSTYQGREMVFIAAAVVGGVNIMGGSGRVLGAVLGAILVYLLSITMIYMGLQDYYQFAMQGIIILVAVFVTVTDFGIVFGSVFTATGSLPTAIAASVATGLGCGVLNGLIIAGTRIPPLVTTLATMNLFRGLSMIVAGTNSFSGFPDSFKRISTTLIGGVVPLPFVYLLVLFVLFNLYFTRGRFGRILKSIGFNEQAARFSGIKTKRTLLLVYSLSGLMAALASLVYLGRLSAAKTSMGNDLNLQVITAVVLGGTSTTGGIGSVVGTFLGVLIIGVLRKGFTLLNFSGNIFNFTLGVILIAALIVFAIMEGKRGKRGPKSSC